MAHESKTGSRALGCMLKLLGFAVMVVAFMALIFFLFSGLSFFLGGDELELPEFSEAWTFLREFTDDFFQQIDEGLDNQNIEEEACLWMDEMPNTVTILESGEFEFTYVA